MKNAPLALVWPLIESSDGGNVEETTAFVKKKLTRASCANTIIP